MVVDFVRELVEASESVDLVVTDISNGRIDKAGRLGAYCGDHLWSVAISKRLATACRARGHEERVVGRSTAAGRGGESGGLGRSGDAGGVGSGRGEGCRGCDYVCHGLGGSVVSGKWVHIWALEGKGSLCPEVRMFKRLRLTASRQKQAGGERGCCRKRRASRKRQQQASRTSTGSLWQQKGTA